MYASDVVVDTIDTADTIFYLSQITDDLNMLIYLISVIMGFAVAILICYLMYTIIKWCVS